MGRRCKYLSAATKQAAKRSQAKSYRQSESGKATKSIANKRYYDKQKKLREFESGLATLGVEIPDELLLRAQKTMRPCLTVNDYGPVLWSPPSRRFFQPPTYLLDAMPWPARKSIGGVWETRAAVLASYQWRDMMEDGRMRIAHWTTQPVDVLHREVNIEVYRRTVGWVSLRNSALDVDEEEKYVHDVALDWGAKVVSLLVEEWEYRTKKGKAAYEQAAKQGKLPWQQFVSQTEHLYESECRRR